MKPLKKREGVCLEAKGDIKKTFFGGFHKEAQEKYIKFYEVRIVTK